MRLITKTILLYLVISVPLLILATLYTYEVINEEVKDGTDEALYREKLNMQNLVKALDVPRDLYLRNDSLAGITLLKEKSAIDRYSDTLIYDKLEEEKIRYRLYRSYFFYNGTHYLISCTKPTLEEDELKEGLRGSFFLVLGLLVFSFLLVSLVLSKTLWKPFYKTIGLLNKYDLNSESPITFDSSSIKEFKNLNEALNKMTDKIQLDYRQQKEFTENASHELQTPLAVIKTKLDLLIQSKKLGREELDLLQGIENSVQKISSLNKALLLLTKIENKQFKEHKITNLEGTVERSIQTFSELFATRHITVKSNLQPCEVDINPSLAELLVNNLLQNAFRHNRDKGEIEVVLEMGKLTISNTGEPLQVKSEELFTRFKKNDASRESLGLGLAIVKSICAVYQYAIKYEYLEGRHVFSVHFIPFLNIK